MALLLKLSKAESAIQLTQSLIKRACQFMFWNLCRSKTSFGAKCLQNKILVPICSTFLKNVPPVTFVW